VSELPLNAHDMVLNVYIACLYRSTTYRIWDHNLFLT